MFRYALTFGGLAGALTVAVASTIVSMANPDDFTGVELLGYLTMLAALSLLFIGIKRYRDNDRGGVISFAAAFGVGAAMSVMATVVYAASWELFSFATDYSFTADYAASVKASIENEAISAAEKARKIAEVDAAIELNRNLMFRLAISATEILPVALIVTLISALILKNPKVLPAKVSG
ncbi:DUF4199 domain-containing protein [Erythrobacter sp. HA6-11]